MDVVWNSLGVIVACLTLIFDIIFNIKARKSNILIQKEVRNQEKFEAIITELLDFYSDLIRDFISKTLLDTKAKEDGKILFEISSVDRIMSLVTEYECKIITFNNKIDFLYKYSSCDNPEYQKFRIKFNDLNSSIEGLLNDFSILVNKCVSSNGVGFSYDEASRIIEDRNKYAYKLQDLYTKNIGDMYVLSKKCIEERNELSIK